LGWSQTETIAFGGTRTHGPQFDEILRSEANAVTNNAEFRYGISGLAMLWVRALEATEDDIRIDKDIHYRFQSSSRE